ncbi:hypothetical protein BDZ89DRAFT_114846 [Hymenopellis radicata]|nr:hypothetical protein BDZ89DRAFT_114846 [Hymenopellis radicata]
MKQLCTDFEEVLDFVRDESCSLEPIIEDGVFSCSDSSLVLSNADYYFADDAYIATLLLDNGHFTLWYSVLFAHPDLNRYHCGYRQTNRRRNVWYGPSGLDDASRRETGHPSRRSRGRRNTRRRGADRLCRQGGQHNPPARQAPIPRRSTRLQNAL